MNGDQPRNVSPEDGPARKNMGDGCGDAKGVGSKRASDAGPPLLFGVARTDVSGISACTTRCGTDISTSSTRLSSLTMRSAATVPAEVIENEKPGHCRCKREVEIATRAVKGDLQTCWHSEGVCGVASEEHRRSVKVQGARRGECPNACSEHANALRNGAHQQSAGRCDGQCCSGGLCSSGALGGVSLKDVPSSFSPARWRITSFLQKT